MSSHPTPTYDVIIIGGGAAGFFAAINIAEQNPSTSILIVEKTGQVLSKVKVSGGGRCNVTHQDIPLKAFAKHYPRGEKELRRLLHVFSAADTRAWFENKGVKLHIESDGRVFPESNNSQSIIDCFLRETQKKKITLKTSCAIVHVDKDLDLFKLQTNTGEILSSNYVVACTGGSQNTGHYTWFKELQQTLTPLYPSLFTFNAASHPFKHLAGISVPRARVRIRNSKLQEEGPLLITHWGISGPAVLKLSAWGAVELAERHYQFDALICWDTSFSEAILKQQIHRFMKEQGKKKINNAPLEPLPKRLWETLLKSSDIEEELTWSSLSHKKINKLIEQLISYPFTVKGKTTFKEEFVIAGGVPLNDIDLDTMQSKSIPGLFFAGEVLNIDGITGGFNFQAAWSTAYVVSKQWAGNRKP